MEISKQKEPIPPLKRGQTNSYSPADIKRWGVQRFLDDVCEKDPITIPDLGFTKEENMRMDEILMQEKLVCRMIYDTNLIIDHIRRQEPLPARAILPVVVVGELEAFALKSDWGYQKVSFMRTLFEKFPIVEIVRELTPIYARIDAFSQGTLKGQLLPLGLSARNMGKNDIWIAATALYLDMELCTNDQDFNHLTDFGLHLTSH